MRYFLEIVPWRFVNFSMGERRLRTLSHCECGWGVSVGGGWVWVGGECGWGVSVGGGWVWVGGECGWGVSVGGGWVWVGGECGWGWVWVWGAIAPPPCSFWHLPWLDYRMCIRKAFSIIYFLILTRDVPDTTLPDIGFNRIVIYRMPDSSKF